MDALTGNWWLWLGVLALVSWAFARYRRVPASPHGHGDHGKASADRTIGGEPRRAHATHGGGCCGGHGRH